MIFAKTSTRTRVAFEVGAFQLGGQPLFLSRDDLEERGGGSMRDTARILSEYLDALVVRTPEHAELSELARHAGVPVINARTDLLHPCQVLADLLTMREVFGGFEGRVVAWIGEGNAVANAWIDAAATLGFTLRLACPEMYEPDHALFERGAAHTRLSITEEPEEAVAGAHVICTDTWVPPGADDEAAVRRTAFRGFTVTAGLVALADRRAIVLHPLPAHPGEEVDVAVLDGPRSRVWAEVRNRLYVQQALLITLVSGKR